MYDALLDGRIRVLQVDTQTRAICVSPGRIAIVRSVVAIWKVNQPTGGGNVSGAEFEAQAEYWAKSYQHEKPRVIQTITLQSLPLSLSLKWSVIRFKCSEKNRSHIRPTSRGRALGTTRWITFTSIVPQHCILYPTVSQCTVTIPQKDSKTGHLLLTLTSKDDTRDIWAPPAAPRSPWVRRGPERGARGKGEVLTCCI